MTPTPSSAAETMAPVLPLIAGATRRRGAVFWPYGPGTWPYGRGDLAVRSGDLAVRSRAPARGHNGLGGRPRRLKRGCVLAERTGVLAELHGTGANRRGTPAYRDDRARRLDAREPRPRGGPAPGGLGPPLERLRALPSRHPDAVEVSSSPDLVLCSPVRDGHLVKHDLSLSCYLPSPAPSCPVRNLTRNLRNRPVDRLNGLSSLPDSFIRRYRSFGSAELVYAVQKRGSTEAVLRRP